MIIQLTILEITHLKENYTYMYNLYYKDNSLNLPGTIPLGIIDDIFPNKQLKFIKPFQGVSLEEQINIQLDRITHSEEFKKTVLDLYEEDHGQGVSNSYEFEQIIDSQFG